MNENKAEEFSRARVVLVLVVLNRSFTQESSAASEN